MMPGQKVFHPAVMVPTSDKEQDEVNGTEG